MGSVGEKYTVFRNWKFSCGCHEYSVLQGLCVLRSNQLKWAIFGGNVRDRFLHVHKALFKFLLDTVRVRLQDISEMLDKMCPVMPWI